MRVNLSEYAARRMRLLAQLGPNALVLIASAPPTLRNGDSHYPYRQSSDFYYLTGFPEAESVAVLRSDAQGSEFVLFNRPRVAEEERWLGPRAGALGACSEYGADQSYPISELRTRLGDYLADCEAVWWLMERDTFVLHALRQALTEGANRRGRAERTAIRPWHDLSAVLHPMRQVKSAYEIDCLRQAVALSTRAHGRALRACRPGLYEYELEAELLHECYRHGSRAMAYGSIVAGGANACILHYQDSQARLEAGELVLIDAGCEYQYYAADLTRTFPVNGRFSDAQRVIYELVLEAQKAAIEAIKPGVCWEALESLVCKKLGIGLMKLGLLTGNMQQLLKRQNLRRFYPHGLGHSLGLDVHDVGDIGAQTLRVGMVLTVEPGLYFPPGDVGIEAQWRGIGVRIEDDVLVTETGCEVLSQALPKTVEAIETWMRS